MHERIYSAAIWYKDLPLAKKNPDNITQGVVVCGHRHGDIIATVVNLLGKRTCSFGEDCSGESEQGFLTNQNRYVNRREGAEIAFKANQIKDIKRFNPFMLFSEDLY
jgi:hypothetical protein